MKSIELTILTLYILEIILDFFNVFLTSGINALPVTPFPINSLPTDNPTPNYNPDSLINIAPKQYPIEYPTTNINISPHL